MRHQCCPDCGSGAYGRWVPAVRVHVRQGHRTWTMWRPNTERTRACLDCGVMSYGPWSDRKWEEEAKV